MAACGAGAGDGDGQPPTMEGELTASRKGFAPHMPEDENTRTTTDSEGTAEGDMGPSEKEEAMPTAGGSLGASAGVTPGVTAAGGDGAEDEADVTAPSDDDSVPSADSTLVGVETAPGYGLVTTQLEYEARAAKENVVTTVVNVKKVREFPD